MVTLANIPGLVVEFAPTNNPYETAPTWVDITDYVLAESSSVSITRGRQKQSNNFSAGVATLTLNNTKSPRRFDPSYSAGPYFGNLKPRKRFRIRGTWSATTYDMFTGWCVGWPQRYDEGGLFGTVELLLVDGIALLAESGLSTTPLDREYVAHPPVVELSTISGSAWTGEGIVTSSATLVSGVAATVPPAWSGGSPMVHVGGLNKWNVGTEQVVGSPTATVPSTLSFWFKADSDTNVSDASPYYFIGTGSGDAFYAAIVGQSVLVGAGALTGGNNEATFWTPVRDGSPHMLAFSSDPANNTVRFYLDGEFVEQVSGTSFSYAKFGGTSWVGAESASSTGYSTNVWIQQLAVTNFAFTDDQAKTHYEASIGQYRVDGNQATSAVLQDVDWPSAWRDLAPRPPALGASRAELLTLPYSGYAINALQSIEDSEQGRLFCARNGYFTFQGRYHSQEVATSVVATFTDDATGTTGYIDIGRDNDELDVRNDVTVNARAGWKSRSTDSASITAHTNISLTINTDLSTEAQVVDMSDGVLQQRKDAIERIPALIVRSGGETSPPWGTLLSLEIGNRIRIKQTPFATGTQSSKDLIIDGIEWNLTGEAWDLTLWASPIPTDVFVLDVSLLDTGRLGF